MGSAKKIVKGLAAGAVLAGVASLIISLRDEKNRDKAREIGQAAHDIKDRVAKHALKLGKLTKSAYGQIVDKTVAEYRGVKALSESDMDELKDELKASWEDIQNILKPQPKPPAAPSKKK